MSTDFIDYLSDGELYQKLIEYGFPKTPVTETTRQILKKKLKHLIRKERIKTKDNSPNKSDIELDAITQVRNAFYSAQIKPRNSLQSFNSNYMSTKSRNSGYNLENRETVQPRSTPRMYAPPPVLSNESETEYDQITYPDNYQKMCTSNCHLDSSSYMNLNGISNGNISDGGVVSRLLSFRDSTLHKKYKRSSMNEPKGTKYAGSNKAKTQFIKFINYISNLKAKPEFNQIFIPYALIIALIAFFSIIAIVYITKRYDQGIIDQSTTNYQLCSESQKSLTDLTTSLSRLQDRECIETKSLQDALIIINKVRYLVDNYIKMGYCVETKKLFVIKMSEVLQRFQVSNIDNIKTLHGVQYLISQNPHWQINIINVQDDTFDNDDFYIDELEFQFSNINLPLKCVLINKLRRFFVILGSLTLIGSAIGALYGIFYYMKMRQRDKLLATENLTKQIINELICYASQEKNADNPEIVIDHLCNKLIPLNKRKKLMKSWNDALRIIEENDTRVLFGIINHNGEEVRTIRWNGIIDDCEITNKKKWQSPAFDNSNRITNPPTPCLKIRHMFDHSEVNHPNLKQLIIDAILEKVGTRCKIIDLQLDKQTCCVYLRCATEADAGIVHNEINGWWFDKRLISIKFLRLERYISRFPKSGNDSMAIISPNLNKNHKRS